jgi:hypothetical protein
VVVLQLAWISVYLTNKPAKIVQKEPYSGPPIVTVIDPPSPSPTVVLGATSTTSSTQPAHPTPAKVTMATLGVPAVQPVGGASNLACTKSVDCTEANDGCGLGGCAQDVRIIGELPPIAIKPPIIPTPPPTLLHGGYPDDLAQMAAGTIKDTWGFDNRSPASYVAFRIHNDYLAGKDIRDMVAWGIQGVGELSAWPANAFLAGIIVNNIPEVGAIALINDPAGLRATYVEGVVTIASTQEVYISQYDVAGNYSEGWQAASGLSYFHF